MQNSGNFVCVSLKLATSFRSAYVFEHLNCSIRSFLAHQSRQTHNLEIDIIWLHERILVCLGSHKVALEMQMSTNGHARALPSFEVLSELSNQT